MLLGRLHHPHLALPRPMATKPRCPVHGAFKRDGVTAKEYHTEDFDWEEHARECAPVVARQREEGLRLMKAREAAAKAALAGVKEAVRIGAASVQGPGPSLQAEQHAGPPSAGEAVPDGSKPEGASARRRRRKAELKQAKLEGKAVAGASAAPLGQGHGADGGGQGSGDEDSAQGSRLQGEENHWDDFYASTARSARFFRARRYLLLEFPFLTQEQPPLHIVELGCGYGASLMPVLKTNSTARVTATDIAPTCVAQLWDVAAREGIPDHESRITSFVCDSADPREMARFQGMNADVALIMFTLSAVDNEGQAAMLRNAAASLRPGGLLAIRDHGLYDMVQLRIPPEQWIGENMYRRGDNTLAFFYSKEDLSAKAEAAGFITRECHLVTVYNTNRRTGQQLRRVFVHGVFEKKGDAEAEAA